MHYVKKYAENAKDAEYRKIPKRQICTNLQNMQNMRIMQNLQNMLHMQNMQSCFKKSTPGSVVPFAMFIFSRQHRGKY